MTTMPTLQVTERSRPSSTIGGADSPHDPVADEADVIVVAQRPAQHDELVAPEAGDGVDVPGQEREPAPDLGEHLVAGVVAERVVDLLEVVQVDVQDRKPAGLSFQGGKGLGQPVHEGDPVRQTGHRVVEDLVGQSVLGRDLRRHVTGDAEGADDLAAVVAKRHLRGRDPGVGSVGEGLPLQLAHDRLAGADDLLLVLEGGCGVFLAEEVEVGLPDYLLQLRPGVTAAIQPALTRRNRLCRSLKYTRSSVVDSRLPMQVSLSSRSDLSSSDELERTLALNITTASRGR